MRRLIISHKICRIDEGASIAAPGTQEILSSDASSWNMNKRDSLVAKKGYSNHSEASDMCQILLFIIK